MRMSNPALWDRLNILAFLAMLCLVAVSLLAQANAQFYAGGDYYQRQTIWVVMGGAAFFGCAVVDLRLVERASYVLYGICLVLLIVTLVVGSAQPDVQFRRWLNIGFFNVQASELCKLAVILALARYLHHRKERLAGEIEKQVGPYGLRDLIKPGILILMPLPLIVLQPDLGTSLMLIFIGATVLLVEGVQRRAILITVLALLVAIPVAWKTDLIQDYQKDRVYKLLDQTWEKVDEDSGLIVETRSTQLEQAIWAISTGGFAGQGHRAANKQRISKLPEIQTDFIAPMVAEEHGFLGMVLLLFLFWFLVMWALRTAHDARSRYCRLVALGIAALIGWQVIINVGMVSGMIPVVGLPLPFLSYGGSSMLMLMAALGLLFNIALRRGRL